MEFILELFWEIFGEHLSLYSFFQKKPYSAKTHKFLQYFFLGILIFVAISMSVGLLLLIANEYSILGYCLLFGSIFYVLLVIVLKLIRLFFK